MLEYRVTVDIQVPDIDLNELMAGSKEYAEQVTPVRTGLLRDSWYTRGHLLINEVPYSFYVDRGTRYMAPRAMSDKTVNWVKANANRYIKVK